MELLEIFEKVAKHKAAIASEFTETALQKMVFDFMASSADSLQFPKDLTKGQRKYVHNYAQQYGLISRSKGNRKNRQLTISRRIDALEKVPEKEFIFTDDSRKLLLNFLKGRKFVFGKSEKGVAERIHFRNPFTSKKLTDVFIPPRSYQSKLTKTRNCLPIFKYRSEILDTIKNNQVTIIKGETGSGKTTQVPQYILEQSSARGVPCRIIVTQPRRLAVISSADRVSKERGEKLGSVVGYQIRLEGCFRETTNLLYTTSGCLVRSLMGNISDVFCGITHAIIDEIHERDKNTDFLLIALRDQLQLDVNFKVILMSATMDTNSLKNYFGNCPIVNVPGRCFQTKIFYLEDVLLHTGYRPANMKNFNYPLNNERKISYNYAVDEDTMDLIDSTFDQFYDEEFKNDMESCLAQFIYLVEEEGISINIQHSKTKKTALIIAAETNTVYALKQILSLNADASIKDISGLTAADYAKKHDDLECFNYLQSGNITNLNYDTEKNLLLNDYEKQFKNSNQDLDHSLILTVIKAIHNSNQTGSILVFLPGYNDIIIQKDYVERQLEPCSYILLLLHSQMKIEDQNLVHRYTPVRKIILATNIAETSVTFEDVTFVIDSGKVKQNMYDAITGTSHLKLSFISKACALQRAGRAGRTKDGICYRLYSQRKFEAMDDYTIPEFLRIPLTEICLFAKAIAKNVSIAEYLSKALQPPTDINIANAINILKAIGAIDLNEDMTDLGKCLVDIPLDVQLAKCLLAALMFRCLDPILIIVSYLSVKDPFILPRNTVERPIADSARKQFDEGYFSDHFLFIKIYRQWSQMHDSISKERFCMENYLSNSSLEMIQAVQHQILEYLKKAQLFNVTERNMSNLNTNSSDWCLIKACLTIGMYPNVAFINSKSGKISCRMENTVILHRSSMLNPGTRKIPKLPATWIVFNEKSKSRITSHIKSNTLITVPNIALFCGPIAFEKQQFFSNDESMVKFNIDSWITFALDKSEAELLSTLRKIFSELFTSFLKQETNHTLNDFVTILGKILQVEEDHDFGEHKILEQMDRVQRKPNHKFRNRHRMRF